MKLKRVLCCGGVKHVVIDVLTASLHIDLKILISYFMEQFLLHSSIEVLNTCTYTAFTVSAPYMQLVVDFSAGKCLLTLDHPKSIICIRVHSSCYI